jgi:hypothetical protein
MFRFQGRVFLKRTLWFVWEPSWDLFRPIDGFSWNGRAYEIVDTSYIKDPFSELFGFGTLEMKALCIKLTDESLEGIESAPVVKEAVVGSPTWVQDRWVVTTSPQTWREHLRVIGCRRRTCRAGPRGKKFTKRTLR